MNKLAAVLMFGASTLFAATAALAQQRPMTFEDLQAIRRVGAPQVSPDGKWVAYDASTIDLAKNLRRSAIYLVPAGGGASRQLTDGAKQDEGPAWSPDGKWIAYTSNRESAAPQIYVYDLAAGTSRKVSNLAAGAASIKWLPDGSGFVAVSDIYPECGVDPACIKTKDDAAGAKPTQARVITSLLYRHWKAWQEPTRSHIVYVPLAGGALRDLTPGTFDAPPFSLGGGDEFDVSPDGRELVYASNTDPHAEVSTNADLFVVPMAGGAPGTAATRITSRTGADTSPKYSPDGRYIAWRSQARAGYESDLWELWLYDRTAKTTRRVAPSFANWIESATWAPDSRSLFIVAPEKAKQVLYEIDVKDGATRLVWNEAAADAVAVSRDNKTIYFDRSSLSSPNEIWSITRGGGATQVTHENDALLGRVAMGAVSDIWYAGADKTQVQALVVKPPMFDPARKYPAIVLIHGGPQGGWAHQWSYRWNPQIFAARGYVVLMPNPRGSYGYGQEFLEQVSGDWGGRAYTDVMNGVDELAAMPFVDGTRVGAAGGSYGGYMVDWILGHTDRFKALVSHAGVYDLESMYGVTEELWFPEWELKGNPWDNPELYQKWSPNRFVKNFHTPTLVSHGELDFRVPINQGLELFTALQRRDVPSKLLYFPDEGHWVLKPQNSKLWYQTVGDWFDQYLK
jgi:dipeptidyl aminopeptidase/acylaminoacyl peptidase